MPDGEAAGTATAGGATAGGAGVAFAEGVGGDGGADRAELSRTASSPARTGRVSEITRHDAESSAA
jgi:hypothetical protein